MTIKRVALLSKSSCFNIHQLNKNYIDPLHEQGVTQEILPYEVMYQTTKKCSAVFAKTYLSDVLWSKLKGNQISLLIIADSTYFKILTKITNPTKTYGQICSCLFDGFEEYKAMYIPNYQAAIYNPNINTDILFVLNKVSEYLQGQYIEPGKDIIKYAVYPSKLSEISLELDKLHNYPSLTCDIETKGLKFYNCGVSSISFAWNKEEGIAFLVDRSEDAITIKRYLRTFFETYKGNLIYHKGSFDIKVLIYNLYMTNLQDYKGMVDGLVILTKNIDDTRLIAYLAINNTVQNQLGLKVLAKEFAGNYGNENIDDTTKINDKELLEYNLKDTLSTWYVYNKYYPTILEDNQLEIYETIFRPALPVTIQMELCGMPIDMQAVKEIKKTLTGILVNITQYIQQSTLIQEYHYEQLELKAKKKTEKAKKKVYTVDDPVIMCDFNPNSDLQLRGLIYTYLGYTPIDFTKNKQPATGTDTLKKLIHQAKTKEHKQIFQHLIDYGLANTILTGFIPAFEAAPQLPDGSYRIYGNFNLGGTKSGRMSSSDINLQNLPSNSKYGKAIKKCFPSPKGWVFLNSDFASLEDRVNALITKDENKLKVYLEGYDGHSLRAYSYFGDQMPDIKNTIQSINSIGSKYKSFRQDSKAPTFALTYGGTFITLMNNCGFSEKEAKSIEKNYHGLYATSDKWVKEKLDQAAKDGYVTCAFGLRLRTPILKQSFCSKTSTPRIAASERRSAGNAVSGQSYGMLTTRAGIEFQKRCLKSKYKYDILPIAHIHDAIYLLVKDRIGIVEWVNKNLIECMAWQELSELKHDKIKIESELDICWPHWANVTTIPNQITKEQLKETAKQIKESVK